MQKGNLKVEENGEGVVADRKIASGGGQLVKCRENRKTRFK